MNGIEISLSKLHSPLTCSACDGVCVLVRVMDCLSLGCLYIGETLSGATVLRHHADSQTREGRS